MNKLKEDILEALTIATGRPLSEIEAIINHQFTSLQEAIYSNDLKVLEVAGFGKFAWRTKGAENKLKKLEEKIALFEKKVNAGQENYRNKLNNSILELEELKKKI